METAMTTRADCKIYSFSDSFRFLSLLRRQTVTLKFWLFLFISLVVSTAWAQTESAPAAQSKDVVYEGYRVHQSVEFGYRAGDTTGSEAMFDTLVNEHEGPRLFDQTLTMHSVDRQGTLFDDLFVNSVGWGGDPNNYLRLRAGKDRWYDFRASFRRNQNVFDYDLLANPLNPPTPYPTCPSTIRLTNSRPAAA